MTASQEKNIHLLYKKIGQTPLEALLEYKKNNPELNGISITYAGRLDPLAEGLLLLLSGEMVNEKEKYTELKKVYEFEVLWGFETDSLDILGLVSSGKGEVSEEKVIKYLKDNMGKFEQVYPIYSSRPVGGKPLLLWAREGRISEIDIPKHEVEIFSSEFLGRRNISKIDLLNDIERKINLVNGDFRQTKILEKWKSILTDSKESFVLDKIKLKVSGGFYVRQFVNDFAKSFGAFATTYHIKRVQIGDYSIADIDK